MKKHLFLLLLSLVSTTAFADVPLLAIKVDIYRTQSNQPTPNMIKAFAGAKLEHQPKLITEGGKQAMIEIGEQDKHMLSITFIPTKDGAYYSANMQYKIKQQDWLQASSESEKISENQSLFMSSQVGEQLVFMQLIGKRFYDIEAARTWLASD
ncbi:hypothetical protein [Pseudoalteromonas pernae]|uniref:hypothetical protein n=1 Tax=Pseudoalteromonas pernae TaxID=3118054 RepID=UPI0032426854